MLAEFAVDEQLSMVWENSLKHLKQFQAPKAFEIEIHTSKPDCLLSEWPGRCLPSRGVCLRIARLNFDSVAGWCRCARELLEKNFAGECMSRHWIIVRFGSWTLGNTESVSISSQFEVTFCAFLAARQWIAIIKSESNEQKLKFKHNYPKWALIILKSIGALIESEFGLQVDAFSTLESSLSQMLQAAPKSVRSNIWQSSSNRLVDVKSWNEENLPESCRRCWSIIFPMLIVSNSDARSVIIAHNFARIQSIINQIVGFNKL